MLHPCCSVLQCVAASCIVFLLFLFCLPHSGCSVLQCVVCVVVFCRVLQCCVAPLSSSSSVERHRSIVSCSCVLLQCAAAPTAADESWPQNARGKEWHNIPMSGPSALSSCSVCCGVLQCVAACCGVLQCAAVCCGVLQRAVACLARTRGSCGALLCARQVSCDCSCVAVCGAYVAVSCNAWSQLFVSICGASECPLVVVVLAGLCIKLWRDSASISRPIVRCNSRNCLRTPSASPRTTSRPCMTFAIATDMCPCDTS
mmetsp:Transcript_74186/g.120491  ORF Transcript_74186/g.120491 Transcript_74186/m.120491 type:complete len:258 (-) Transcript_74186:734-1507(-)